MTRSIQIKDSKFLLLIGSKLFTRFKEAVGDYSFKNLTLEIKNYKSLKNEEFQAATSLEEWKLIKKMKTENGTRFPILSRLVEILFTLPFSTAEIERVFSTLKLTKTPLRNKLADETLNNIMRVKESLKRKAFVIDENNKEDLKRIKIILESKKNKKS